MGVVNLVNDKNQIVFGNDAIVIQKWISGIKGGRVLDMTDYTESVLHAGHVIIKSKDGVYKPMPVSECGYSTLPENHTYVGVLYCSIESKKPAASIMIAGDVNEAAVPYEMTSIMKDFKDAVPTINFVKDEEA